MSAPDDGITVTRRFDVRLALRGSHNDLNREIRESSSDAPLRVEGQFSAKPPLRGHRDPKGVVILRHSDAAFEAASAGGCRPYASWRIGFTHELDTLAARPDCVRIEPPVPFQVDAYGKYLAIQADSRPGQAYTVHLSPEIIDVRGRKLGATEPLLFEVAPLYPFVSTNGDVQVLREPTLTVLSAGCHALQVDAYRVEFDDFADFAARRHHLVRYAGLSPEHLRIERRGYHEPPAPGRKVHDAYVLVPPPGEGGFTETAIDLTAAFEGREVGHLVVTVRPDTPEVPPLTTWLQHTRLELDVAAEGNAVQCQIHSSVAGVRRPQAGVQVRAFAWSREAASSPFVPVKTTCESDADGTAQLAVKAESRAVLVLARQGADSIFTSVFVHEKRPPLNVLWCVWTDRAAYRAGETVQVVGWLRCVSTEREHYGNAVSGKVREVQFRIVDRTGREQQSGVVQVDSEGAFHFACPLSASMPSRQAFVSLRAVLARRLSTSTQCQGIHQHLTIHVLEHHRPPPELVVPQSPPVLSSDPASLVLLGLPHEGDNGAPSAGSVGWGAWYRPGAVTLASGFVAGAILPKQSLWREWRTASGRDEPENGRSTARSLAEPRGFPLEALVTAGWSSEGGARESVCRRFSLLPSNLCVALHLPAGPWLPGTEVSIEATVSDWGGVPIMGVPFTVSVRTSSDDTVATYERVSTQAPVVLSLPVPSCGSLFVEATARDEAGRLSRTFAAVPIAHVTPLRPKTPSLPTPPLRVTLTHRAPRHPHVIEECLDIEVRDAYKRAMEGVALVVMLVDEAAIRRRGHAFDEPAEAFARQLTCVREVRHCAPDPSPSRAIQAALRGMYRDDGLTCCLPPDPDKFDDTSRRCQEHIPPALLFPDLRTDALGSASVIIPLDHRQTRYRVIAQAYHGGHFGRAEATIAPLPPLEGPENVRE